MRAGDSLVLIEGDDFVLVKRAPSTSSQEVFEKLSSATQDRFARLGLTPDEVVRAVQWARESS